MGLGELLQNAGMNTLMGMGVVFAVLILISFIISLFSFIGKAEQKLNRKEKNKPAETIGKAPTEAADLANDRELVAVIAAAVAAYEGTSPDGLVVRSIKRVSDRNRWKRG